MKCFVAATLGLLLVVLPLAGTAAAQSLPLVKGAVEIQAGIGATLMPEDEEGFVSVQPELRVGWFLGDGLMIQAMGDSRVWPLGTVGSSSYGVTGNLLWFPNLGPGNRNFYLLGGAGGTLQDPPGPAEGSSFDTLLRAGIGAKAPMAGVGVGWLDVSYFTMEFRTDLVIQDETNFVSGISMGLSWFR
jgi:hypothetical protein